ncbi:MAG: NAD(+) synthase [Christensenella sp.]|uniref:NAD(+) synthase n=1 Tax=Christensenella sp. TaxID=1935934 RepID=UPI002B1E99C9|nr:NAD(+) synthase [Christensenella sp.]MEA5004684.1 NAD(+) synthase [Christensenella sp.]
MKQRLILNDISPDFKRDTQTSEEYIEKKKKQSIAFVEHYLEWSGAKGIVLGMSGGVDSFLVGALCAVACGNTNRKLHLVLLPNGQQSDIGDAHACAKRIVEINPQTVCDSVSIAGGYAGAVSDLKGATGFSGDVYTLGNLQPRLRMMYQYALSKGMLVAGTDHATESITGFYTKYGDGGSDINPIQELVKDDIYEMSKMFGVPEAVLKKQPAAGLGISATDEEELGIRYDDICAYLKGYKIADDVREKLEGIYDRSAHKRALPASLKDEYYVKKPTVHIHVGQISDERILRTTIADINAHPEQIVLYIGEYAPEQAFYDEIIKTVNTPIAHYNMFCVKDKEAVNETFGNLTDCLKRDMVGRVVVSGEVGTALSDAVVWLMHNGFEVTLLKDCLTRIKK